MTLDIDIPELPALDGPQDPQDYNAVVESEERVGDNDPREALATFLQEGAWDVGFDEWRDYTYMTEEEFRIVREHGLIGEFGFLLEPHCQGRRLSSTCGPADFLTPDGEPLDRGKTIRRHGHWFSEIVKCKPGLDKCRNFRHWWVVQRDLRDTQSTYFLTRSASH